MFHTEGGLQGDADRRPGTIRQAKVRKRGEPREWGVRNAKAEILWKGAGRGTLPKRKAKGDGEQPHEASAG